MFRRGVIVAMTVAVGALSACAPEWSANGDPTSTTTTTTPVASQSTSITYSGPRGNCDQERVLTGVRVRPCQGLANTTASVIVSSKVLDPWCIDFFAYYPIVGVVGTATQGAVTKPLVQTDTTPGSPAYDTGFDVTNGPIAVSITDLRVDLAGGLACGWFG